MFVHLLVKVVQSLFHLFARILFDNFTQLLFVKGQLVAHLLLTYTLGYTCLNSFKEMLQERDNSLPMTHILHIPYIAAHVEVTLKDTSSYIEFF